MFDFNGHSVAFGNSSRDREKFLVLDFNESVARGVQISSHQVRPWHDRSDDEKRYIPNMLLRYIYVSYGKGK